MLPSFRFAGIITAILGVCGSAMAQELAPANSGVSIQKVAIDNEGAHTVKYYVTGGSPRLQALVRRVEWTENELSVIEQLQMLKLDSVVNERRIAAFRTTQLTTPFFPSNFYPRSRAWGSGGHGESFLQRALSEQLADEATPEAALQTIGFLEQMQTALDAELKALPPQEKKAAEGPVDALRPRLAALTRRDVPPPRPQPVAPLAAPQARLAAPAVPRQPAVPQGQVALEQTVRQYQEVVRQQLQQPMKLPAQAAPQRLPMPLGPIAFPQMARQQFAQVQQLLQKQ
jgi:hypothetical protein